MSKVKKAIKKLETHREYFSNVIFESAHYKRWATSQNFLGMFDAIRVMLACDEGKKDIEQALAKNLALLNFILSDHHKPHISQWYKHPDEQAKRLERKQDQIVRHLIAICADYKTHLFDVVHQTTNCFVTTISLLTGSTINPDVDKTIPIGNSALHAVTKYKEIDKLQSTLLTPVSAMKKLKQCEAIFKEGIQETLSSHRDHWATRILTILLNVFSLALPSKMKQNTFCFWKSIGESVTEAINIQFQKANKLSIS